MRILLIAPQPFFEIRGTPMNVKMLAESLAEGGYKVDLLVFPFGDDVDLPRVRIIRSPRFPFISTVPIGPSLRKALMDVFLTIKAVNLFFTHDYKVVHGVEEGAFIAGTLSMFRSSSKFVFDMDSCMPDQFLNFKNCILRFFFVFLESFFLKRADAVLTVCRSLTERAKLQISKSAVIAQIEDCPIDGSDRVDSQMLLDLNKRVCSKGEKVIAYTGNFESYQGIDLLFKAFVEVCKNWKEDLKPKLLMIGGGKRGDVLFEKYKTLAADLGISNRVVFEGNRPSNQMGTYMQFADLLVSPRIKGDNTPLKLYSYLASGTALLATNLPTHTQIVNSDIAFLSEPNPKDFAFGILNALAIDFQRSKKALKAKEFIEVNHSRAVFSKKVLQLYREILKT